MTKATTPRLPGYLRRRAARLQADELHREQQRQLCAQLKAMAEQFEVMAALFQTLEQTQAVEAHIDQTVADGGQMPRLRKALH